MTGWFRHVSAMVASVVVSAPAVAQAAEPSPALQAEQSDVAQLPAMGAHWVFPYTRTTAITIYDGDNGHVLGTIPATPLANNVITPDRRTIYVTETSWSLVDHGDRHDMLQQFDARTLERVRELALPPRALVGRKQQNFDVDANGKLGFIFDLSPASAVTVVDLSAFRVVRTVDIPGCALVFPWQSGGFSSLCGDGSLTNVAVGTDGKASVTHSKPFFSADGDPVYEQSLAERAKGDAYFITYSGKVMKAHLGPQPVIEPAWSIQQAAGQPAAGTGVQELAWRPGGTQPFAMSYYNHHLFALMHTGTYWTHKTAGTEVWELDTQAHRLVRRIDLPAPAKVVAVSQDEKPLLYANGENGNLMVIDLQSGKTLRNTHIDAGAMTVTPP
ncbi:amine dehydrogenase large subunit [Komagataeibacter swingsii]|nr:amine dehydrogenase large subunit [Komagataeibacter swingsii]GBQ60744.1 hypothetical protein AA16373_1977 [Komagataeibacter swingsii DSM 16373]